MIRTYRIEGVVIRKDKMGEADYRLTVLSKNSGKLVIIAKGVRKITSRKAPHLDLLNHLKLFLAKGKTFDILTDVEAIDNFSFLKTHLSRIAVSFKMIELVNRLIPEREEHTQIFGRLLSDFHLLNKHIKLDETKITDDFANYLLWQSGYLPQDQRLAGIKLERFLEDVCERTIKSNILLTKLS
ncbi:DNA repair protein RecO [Candidatus Gottesmanbacteria bacterium RBG_16_37_8]|uniref:DNA repair protein RecO n=1 Tax=Candidatus Gottesmanbacteria bacterium RBG_16_37_8 TaxID=1798371 RepID=A0A1F5YTU5_9BACT|nr:MAG: DNA repair protein RecO [Candidatus Gottesmanbacteria bacterium RBG_16_37_8]